MRIAFYAPMKSPASPRPSGDRKIARLFMSALSAGSFVPFLASEFRSWEGSGNIVAQKMIKNQGLAIAKKMIQQYKQMDTDQKPIAWFTYHLYHKSPDWIGPVVSEALGIPYFVAEASVSPKQRDGNWSEGYSESLKAIHQAARIFCINPKDISALQDTLGSDDNLVSIAPFLDQNPNLDSATKQLKNTLSRQYKLNPDQYWLLTVAMMREDSKLSSYQVLAKAVDKIQRKDWQLIIVGDGVAETLVKELFRNDFKRQVHFVGRKDAERIDQLMQAADLFVWPAVNEALGMVALEALSNGLPNLLGNAGGIQQIIEHEETGLLLENPESANAPDRFATAIDQLLSDPIRLAKMRTASLTKFANHHHLQIAADQIASHIKAVIKS